VVRAERRHWPYPWSRLEELRRRGGDDPEVVREWLRAEVERRRAALNADTTLVRQEYAS
jgi:hypothetical protein